MGEREESNVEDDGVENPKGYTSMRQIGDRVVAVDGIYVTGFTPKDAWSMVKRGLKRPFILIRFRDRNV